MKQTFTFICFGNLGQPPRCFMCLVEKKFTVRFKLVENPMVRIL